MYFSCVVATNYKSVVVVVMVVVVVVVVVQSSEWGTIYVLFVGCHLQTERAWVAGVRLYVYQNLTINVMNVVLA